MTANRRQVLKLGVVDFGVESTTLPNGLTIELPVIRHPGASAVVAIDDRQRVTILRQYRHAAGTYIWEIPAGCRDSGEEPIDCARRELTEEAGLTAARWDHLGLIVTIPSFCNERIDLFLARSLESAELAHEPDEIIEVEQIPLEQALEMIRRGEIIDAKTICGLYKAKALINETEPGDSEPVSRD